MYLVYTTVNFLHYKIPDSSVYPYSDSSSTAAAAPTNTPTTIPTAAPSIPDNILSPPLVTVYLVYPMIDFLNYKSPDSYDGSKMIRLD